MKPLFASLALCILSLFLAPAAFAQPATNEVETGVTRSGICTELSEAQFQQMAEQLTTTIFTDEAFIEISAAERPSLVIGTLVNDSHSYQLEVDVMFNALRNVIVRSRAVRLFAQGAYADLALAAQLTSTLLGNNRGQRDSSFTLNITLTTPSGEYIGAWSVTRAFRC